MKNTTISIKEKINVLSKKHDEYLKKNDIRLREPYSWMAYLGITRRDLMQFENEIYMDKNLTKVEQYSLDKKLILMKFDIISALNQRAYPPKNLDTLISMIDPLYNKEEERNFHDLINISITTYKFDINAYRQKIKDINDGKIESWGHWDEEEITD